MVTDKERQESAQALITEQLGHDGVAEADTEKPLLPETSPSRDVVANLLAGDLAQAQMDINSVLDEVN